MGCKQNYAQTAERQKWCAHSALLNIDYCLFQKLPSAVSVAHLWIPEVAPLAIAIAIVTEKLKTYQWSLFLKVVNHDSPTLAVGIILFY